jgi:hypothetical protein
MDAPQYLCSQLVALSWEGGETTANLEEIQTQGGVVESDSEVGIGAQVEIRCGDVCFAGKVTGAEEHAFGWRLTVEFSPLTLWSPEQFRPDHLFDPAAMLKETT